MKGNNKEIRSHTFIGRLPIILDILSNGNWFLLGSYSNIDPNTFCYFMKELENWIFENNVLRYERALWIMKSCQSHINRLTYRNLTKANFITILSVYPQDLTFEEIYFAY